MPITKITSENFKGMSERTEAELKPITVKKPESQHSISTFLVVETNSEMR